MTIDLALVSPDIVTVYGRDTCDDTMRALAHFDAAGLAYRYVNLDLDPGALALVRDAGFHHTPVVVTPEGGISMEPTDEELAAIVAAAP